MTTAITDFIPPLQLRVDNAPRVLMIHALRETLIDFCERTQYWRYECDDLLTAAVSGTVIREYALDVPVQTDVVSIRSITFNSNKPVAEQSMDWLDRNDPGWRSLTGNPDYYVLRDPGTILLSREPSAAGLAISAVVCLKPSHDALTVGDILLTQCRAAIAAGAAANLKKMTGKPWSDLPGAQMNGTEYEAAVEFKGAFARDAYTTRRKVRAVAQFM